MSRAADLLAAALFALFVALAVPVALDGSLDRARLAWHARHETALDARRRCLGADFVDAIESIRRALRPGEPYLIVEGAQPYDSGTYWVRYELAPHRAVFVGWRRDLHRPALLRKLRDEDMRWVVIASFRDAPALYDRRALLREMSRPNGG